MEQDRDLRRQLRECRRELARCRRAVRTAIRALQTVDTGPVVDDPVIDKQVVVCPPLAFKPVTPFIAPTPVAACPPGSFAVPVFAGGSQSQWDGHWGSGAHWSNGAQWQNQAGGTWTGHGWTGAGWSGTW